MKKVYQKPTALVALEEYRASLLAGSEIKFSSQVKVTPYEEAFCDSEDFVVTFD